MKTLTSAGPIGFLLFAVTASFWTAQAQQDEVSPGSTTRIVEEKTTIETRRVYQTETVKRGPRKPAIFVDNRAGAQYNDKVLFFEDQVASRAASQDFSIISREDALKAVKIYRGTGGAGGSKGDDITRDSLGTGMDQLLSDSSSALRVAQNMGADFLLCVTIGSYAKETRSFNDPSIGVNLKNIVHNLRGTYKVLEGVTGGALGGDAFKESKTIRQTETLQIDDQDTLNELLEKAAADVANGLAAKAAGFVPPSQAAKVEVSIACGVKDLEGNEISLPDLRITENNTLVKENQLLPAQASATIEIDGFAMGTTPARIKVPPGAHKLRLSRPGFETLEFNINAAEGLDLTPTMQLSADGFKRWKEIRDFLNHLDASRKLTDAKAEEIRGRAQMLRQSYIRFDVNTLIKKNSIFSQDNY